MLQCPLCKSGFKKQAALTEHIARKHATNKPFKVLFLVAPSRRAERLIYSLWCPDGCMVGWLVVNF